MNNWYGCENVWVYGCKQLVNFYDMRMLLCPIAKGVRVWCDMKALQWPCSNHRKYAEINIKDRTKCEKNADVKMLFIYINKFYTVTFQVLTTELHMGHCHNFKFSTTDRTGENRKKREDYAIYRHV